MQLLMIYLMLLSSRATLYAQNKTIAVYIMLAVCALITLYVPRTRNTKLYVLFVMLAGSLFLTRYINGGGLGMDYLLINVSTIWVTYIAYQLDKDRFAVRFVKVVTFFAAVSLVFWLLCFIMPSVMQTILIGKTSFFKGTKGMLLYTFRYATWAMGDTRNVGIFTEPGVYQIALNAAVFFLLFARERLHLTNKQIYTYLAVLVVTLLTTQSTTGFLCLGIIVVGYLLTSGNTRLRRTILIVLALGAGFLAVNYFIAREDSILQSVIIDKLFSAEGDLDLNESTGYWRMNGIKAGWQIFLENPLGAGDNYMIYFRNIMGEETASGAGIFYTLGIAGIITFLIYCYFHVYEAFKRIRRLIPFVVYLALWIFNGMANTEIIFACFLGIALVGIPPKDTVPVQDVNAADEIRKGVNQNG